MGILSKFKSNKNENEERDLILEETARDVLGIELTSTNKNDTFSKAYRNALEVLAVQIRLQDSDEKKKFVEEYGRRKLEALKMEHPEEYEQYLLQKANMQGNVLENGAYEIIPTVRLKYNYMFKCGKRNN